MSLLILPSKYKPYDMNLQAARMNFNSIFYFILFISWSLELNFQGIHTVLRSYHIYIQIDFTDTEVLLLFIVLASKCCSSY